MRSRNFNTRANDVFPFGANESRNACSLPVPEASIHTCRAEITALLLETRSDVGEEALRWLEERGERDG